MPTKMLPAGVLVAAILAVGVHSQSIGNSPPPTNGVPGNEPCASCHRQIYDSYSKTAMARASGDAADGLIAGEFEHKQSGVRYRVYEQSGRIWMSYERQGDSEFRGQKQLLYYIG